MPNVFNDTLGSWQNFYFMIGGASAALLGLMFVALSLGTHLITDETRESMRFFVTPSLIYFVTVLVVSAAMLVPAYTPPVLAVGLFVGAVVGLGRTLQHVRGLVRAALKNQDFNVWDWLFQIILPVANYGLLLVAAIGFGLAQWSLGFAGVSIMSVSMLVTSIANTWSLVIWIVEQGQE
jgi:hypothetical protein